MDHGPPDPKRSRLGSGSWSSGHTAQRGSLPPLPPGPPHQSQYPPPPAYARPASQVPLHHLEDRRHHESDFPTPAQDPRPHSVTASPYQPFVPPRDPVVKRDQSAEPAQMQYHRPQSTGDIADNHVNSYPADDPRRQSIPYEAVSAPPVTTQPYRPAPAYPQTLYAPPNPSYERQPYEPPPTPGGLREGIHLSVAYASGSGPGYNRRKAPRTSQVNTIQSFIIPVNPVLTFLRLATPAELRRRNVMIRNHAVPAKKKKSNVYGRPQSQNSRLNMSRTLLSSLTLL
jgi:hypothetical protein